ncbi:MAG: cysteine hydrolase [Alphaproteobacteria bacterium]|nr:cysteine hydrolase [Alphaproteobacteria bacterium]
MHNFRIPADVEKRVIQRRGRLHAYETLAPSRTALIVVDMQNAFVKEGAGHAYVPEAASTCPNINRLADATRASGGTVVWILNTVTKESLESWSHFHRELSTPAGSKRRTEAMSEGAHGHELYETLQPRDEDLTVRKSRYSAFIPGSSDIDQVLRNRDINTVLVTGTATNVCCESTARDAMMLNYRTIMVSDACSASTDDQHAAALYSFAINFGDVQTTDELVARLRLGNQEAVAAE